MKKYARVIEARYKICHYPDSLVLSAAKFYDLPIVTLDKNMLKIAKYEKIVILLEKSRFPSSKSNFFRSIIT